jgi:alpha-amylase/alpha-mannosidase (GH57 family)
MPKIYISFLWHMHQPFYKDLVTGEYKLPWTRMHALKDYYGMVRILEEFPKIHQTFNLVPSMMVQIEEYAANQARDPLLALALKAAEQLTADEKRSMLRNFFLANPSRMIQRYPRYRELFQAWEAQKHGGGWKGVFSTQDFRDLQVLSQLAWFDEEIQEHDAESRRLIEKGRDFTLEDQALMGRKQVEIIGLVIPEYKKLAATGQIEISTTPFYHPILPLLCDSDIAGVAHPHVPLPHRFSYPDDARYQLTRAREYVTETFGVAPVGLWPSEGSVSDQVFEIAAEVGFKWAATDNGVLDRTLGRPAGLDGMYRTWQWKRNGRSMGVIFRDHMLSDLVGFVYSGMQPADAANDLLRRIRDNCAGILNSGRDALVPIILDGENAWEYYEHNGRPFFRELYGRLSADSQMECVTVSEAFERLAPSTVDHIFPGSWINANFDVWIGADEDNRAWEYLLAARKAYDAVGQKVSDDRRRLAYEELLIAEGSDWCWWYGPEHDTANRVEFDELYRAHLANVYAALTLAAPEELSRPIIHVREDSVITQPTGRIRPKIDGIVSSYFEWMGAGRYQVAQRGGAMHGKRFIFSQIQFGTDGEKLFVRIDFAPDSDDILKSGEVRCTIRCDGQEQRVSIKLTAPKEPVTLIPSGANVDWAVNSILEIAIPLSPKAEFGPVDLALSAWKDGLPVDAVPQQGWLTIAAESTWST